MGGGDKRSFSLKWPWNWVACGLFVLATFWFLGIFSIVLAALFLWFQKKRHAGEVPQGGYCLDRTRKRLARLVWALLYLVIAAAGGVVFFVQMGEDHSAWKVEDWGTLIVCGVVAVGGTLLGLYEAYTDLRDVFRPEKSRLAQSIRSQLPRPDDKYTVAELFAMVDDDIRENGIWFDRVAVGKQWVLGDDASFIPRIRGVFPRDEIRTRTSANRVQSSRIVQLWLVDDRKQLQCTDLRSPGELDMAVNCLRLRCPDAHFAPYNQLSNFIGKSDREWQAMERERFHAQEQKERKPEQKGRGADEFAALDEEHLAAFGADRAAVAEQFSGLKQRLREEQPVRRRGSERLTLSERGGVTRDYDSFTRRDVELAGEGLCGGKYTVAAYFAGAEYLYLRAGERPDGRITVNASRPDPDQLRVFETDCSPSQAAEWLLERYDGTFAPDFSQWKDITELLKDH